MATSFRFRGHADGRFEYVDPAFLRYTGLTAERVYGAHEGWMDAVHPDDVERVRAMWSAAAWRLDRYDLEARLRGADGQYRTFWGIATPVYRDGVLAGWDAFVSGVDAVGGKPAALDDQKRWTPAGSAAPGND